MAIKNFSSDELQIVANMQDEFRVGVYVVTPAFRKGITCGVLRALEAARNAPEGKHLAAIEEILD